MARRFADFNCSGGLAQRNRGRKTSCLSSLAAGSARQGRPQRRFQRTTHDETITSCATRRSVRSVATGRTLRLFKMRRRPLMGRVLVSPGLPILLQLIPPMVSPFPLVFVPVFASFPRTRASARHVGKPAKINQMKPFCRARETILKHTGPKRVDNRGRQTAPGRLP
jgi:hypothetical protein